MNVKVLFDEKGYVVSWCEMGELEGSQEFEVDETLWNDCWYAFRLEDNQLVYDETYKTIFEQQEQIEQEISQLKKYLKDTDYKALKFAEGWITAEQYADVLNQRQAWRDEINALTERLEQLDD